jgi:hypothetical protein
LATDLESAMASVAVSHFSTGFVGDGIGDAGDEAGRIRRQ